MTETLTVTGYVGRSLDDVVAVIEASPEAIVSAATAATARAAALIGEAGDVRARIETAGDRLLIHAPGELDGASVTLRPVPGPEGDVTELKLQLGERFVGGDQGRGQLMAATKFVSSWTEELQRRIAA